MTLSPGMHTVPTPDGRQLEVLVEGAPDGRTLLFHSGTPSGATSYPAFAAEAAQRELRLVSYSRPGYGDSTPQPGRTVADVASDVTTLLAALEAEHCLTMGWSGGGPHALACAALLPERCAAAAVLAGVAPFDAEGLNWLLGMGQENLEEFGAALAGEEIISAVLEALRGHFVSVTADEVAASLGGLAPPVDQAALTGEFAESVAASFRQAMLRGIEGWRDDDLAFTRPWGFDLGDISVPVAIWQGGQDKMVPFGHGKWLAAHVPASRVHLYDDEGHLSVITRMDRILDDLLDLAG
jgi:pimeloyl-ACP methyl ester carboxylesterase